MQGRSNQRIFLRVNFKLFESYAPDSYKPINGFRTYTLLVMSQLSISMVDRYFMPTGSRLLRNRADERRSVEMS